MVTDLLVFEVLYGPQTFEGAVDHDGQPSAQSFTLLHAGETETDRQSTGSQQTETDR
jgi:hypothetical protein